jgi:hypothetical protein
MNPVEQTSAQNFVPYAPFEILVINPDRFLKMRGMIRKMRRWNAKFYDRTSGHVCEACIFGKHRECSRCGCLCAGEFRPAASQSH